MSNLEEIHFYHTIVQPGIAEFKDRGSKFIAYAFPIENTEDFKQALEQVKKEHPKATHHCFGYRLGLDGNNYRVSDDGEPSGTAGKPILGQIDSKKVTNTLVIVVRYFGGTQLGVPGLINAYKTATSLVLQVTQTIQKQVEIPYKLHFDYTNMNDVLMIVKQCGATVIDKQIGLFCDFTIGIPSQRVDEVLYRLKDLYSVEVKKI